MAKANFTIRCSWCCAPTLVPFLRKPPVVCPWCHAGSWLDARDPRTPYTITAADVPFLRALQVSIEPALVHPDAHLGAREER
jgi:hypothetical protein